MKRAELTKQTTKELETLLTSERQALAKAVVDSRTKEIKNVKAIHGHKQTIARALTLLRERAIAEQEEAK